MSLKNGQRSKAARSILRRGRQLYPPGARRVRHAGEKAARVWAVIQGLTCEGFDQFEREAFIHGLDRMQAAGGKPVERPSLSGQLLIRFPPCFPARVIKTLIGVGNFAERVDQMETGANKSLDPPRYRHRLRGTVIQPRAPQKQRHGFLVSNLLCLNVRIMRA
jgi:hypothetical protein